MRKRSMFLLLVGATIASVSTAGHATEVDWVRQFDKTPADEYAFSVAVGADGSAYVAGFDAMHSLLRRFDTTGTQIWNADFGPVEKGTVQANGIAVDPAGNVYVAGEVDEILHAADFGIARRLVRRVRRQMVGEALSRHAESLREGKRARFQQDLEGQLRDPEASTVIDLAVARPHPQSELRADRAARSMTGEDSFFPERPEARETVPREG